MPRPPVRPASGVRTCVNISKIRSSASFGMPAPSSRTSTTTLASSTRAASSTRPPSAVNLLALVSRLHSTCATRSRSASSQGVGSGSDTPRCWARPSNSGCVVSCAEATISASGVGARRNCSLPLVMRETSSRSSSSRAMWPTWRSMTSKLHCLFSSLARGERAIIAACRTGASGLRSSWASVARNSSLRRSASRSASSCRLRPVMSENQTARSPSQGEAITSNQRRWPSTSTQVSNRAVLPLRSAPTARSSNCGSSVLPGTSVSRTPWPAIPAAGRRSIFAAAAFT